uniref:PGG domain-containing protein n=2 Tax=Aegilops tauschii subsp. strangulata TaxID=200361 RepID=A0A453PXC1_AEGTS
HARRKYLMLLGILVASVAYQAGLEPPSGAWQSSGNGYEAGDPVMHNNMRPRREGRRMEGMVAEGDEPDDQTGSVCSPGGLCSRLQQGVEDVCDCGRAHHCRAELLCNPYDTIMYRLSR